MILNALYKLYDRMAADPETYHMSTPGYSSQKISMEVLFEPDGHFVGIRDIRHTPMKINKKGESVPGKPVPVTKLLFGGAKSSGKGKNPCFVWDNPKYALGIDPDKLNNIKDIPEAASQKMQDYFESFRELHLSREKEINLPAYSSLCRMLEQWSPDKLTQDDVSVLKNAGQNFLVFRLANERRFLHEYPELIAWWERHNETQNKEAQEVTAQCLITGEIAPVARLHEPAIKGIPGAQSSGAKIVSYNCKAFVSYGKDKGANAPVSKTAAFKYCNALNTLLSNARHKISMSDTVLTFWTEAPHPVEDALLAFLSLDGNVSTDPAQNEKLLAQVKQFLTNVRNGTEATLDNSQPFYILGISPNVSRLSVRFWQRSSAGEIGNYLNRFLDEMSIVRSEKDDKPFTVKRILSATARDDKDISPVLEGQLIRAIITGAPYPTSLALQIIGRIKAEGLKSAIKAAILKAFLIRNYQQTNLTMSLDTTNNTTAYLLGRLLATLEKAQGEALDNVNASICDRYYVSASQTPRLVFPRLLSLSRHHLAKLTPGRKIQFDNLIGNIMNEMDATTGMPAHCTLQDQALFALGYYQQRQDFFTKKETTNNEQ